MLSRHGTKLPKAKELPSFQNLENLAKEVIRNYFDRKTKPDKGPLCDQDLELLRDWRWQTNITSSESEFLTIQGYQDMQTNAKYYKNLFSELLTNIYTPEKFKFRYTNTERTNSSYHAFIDGLFGPGSNERISIPPPPNPDYLLRPYESCKAWKNNDQTRANPNSEVAKFINSAEYQQMLRDVSTRLGFKYALDADQINTIWDLCRYEQAWNIVKLSPWCVAFTKDQVDLLEYKEDLQLYYKSGYGRPINSRIPCELMKDLLNHFQSDTGPNVIAYFSHDDMINTMLVALRSYKDAQPLRADNFNFMRRRLWKSSELNPFAANIVAAKYK